MTTKKDMTVSDYADRWKKTILPILDKAATRDTFTSHLKVIVDLIGGVNLNDVNGMVQQDLVRDLRETRAARTTKAIMSTFRYVLSQAVTEGFLKELPPKPKLPKVLRRQQPYLTHEQMRDLVAVAEGRTKAYLAVLAETGARIGEVVGLQWGDFDFDEKTLFIQRSVYRGKAQPPKTPSAIRKIAVSSYLIKILQAYKPENAQPTDYLFVTNTGEFWEAAKSWYTVKRVFQKLKMPMQGFHQFRRGNTTVCRNLLGMPTTIVDMRTGHVSSGSLTDTVYTITKAGDDKRWIEDLGRLLFAERGEK